MPRYLAIGDIHGCFDALRTLREFVGFRNDDVIITLGDYCDRGPNTAAVLDWLIECDRTYDLQPLRGNHEIMMLESRENAVSCRDWLAVGGAETLRSYAPFDGDPGKLEDVPENHWSMLSDRLLPYFETETHIFVHANLYAELPLAEQPEFMLYWERFNDPPLHMSGKTMVCGHTSQKSGLPATNGNAICIDTWAYGDGWLSCLDVESGRIWQANERGETRKFWLEA